MSNPNRIAMALLFAGSIVVTALVTRNMTVQQFTGNSNGPMQGNHGEAIAQKKKPMRQPPGDQRQGIAPLPSILIADEEFAKADELEDLNRVQRDRNIREPSNSPVKTAPSNQSNSGNPKSSKSRDTRTVSQSENSVENKNGSLEKLSDEEKNELWWRIAAVARRSGDVAYSYSLTAERASPFAREYNVSIRDIFNFFKEGVKAEWRKREYATSDAPRKSFDSN